MVRRVTTRFWSKLGGNVCCIRVSTREGERGHSLMAMKGKDKRKKRIKKIEFMVFFGWTEKKTHDEKSVAVSFKYNFFAAIVITDCNL